MKRIVFTGGGTAGHVTPNLALIPHFLEEGWDVDFDVITGDRGEQAANVKHI